MAIKRIVIAFGRYNPPTSGHAAVFDVVRKAAKRLQADALVVPTQTQDPKKNPLAFKEKVTFLRQLFPWMNFTDTPAIRTAFDALAELSKLGYEEVYLVVGSDREKEFRSFGKYIVPRSTRNAKKTDILLDKYDVIVVPAERDADSDSVTGVSASKMREFAAAGDFEAFRAGVPTANPTLAKAIYTSVRDGQTQRRPNKRVGVPTMQSPHHGDVQTGVAARSVGEVPKLR